MKNRIILSTLLRYLRNIYSNKRKSAAIISHCAQSKKKLTKTVQFRALYSHKIIYIESTVIRTTYGTKN